MLTELQGFIGLSAKVSACPSGLYVDALPDISVLGLDRLIDGEGNATELWAEVEQRALAKFRTLFIQELNKCHRVTDVAKAECLIYSNKELLATALWYLFGAEVQYARSTSSRMNSYTTIDHSKAKEMQEYFENEFAKELHIAVAGIDIHHSPCFGDCEPAIADIMTFHTPII